MSSSTDNLSTNNEGARLPVYIFNKREHYESAIATGAPDERLDDVKLLVKGFEADLDAMYERRKKIDGVGMLSMQYLSSSDMLAEAFQSYVLGHYYSTISMCGSIAERMCYDYIAMADVRLFGNALTKDSTEMLFDIPFRSLLELLTAIRALTDENKKRLNAIYDIRNKYVHPKRPGDAGRDALTVLNDLCNVMESRFSVFRFYDIIDGKLHLKPEIEKRQQERNSS